MSGVLASANELKEEGLWVRFCEGTGTDLDAVENGVLDPNKPIEVPSDVAYVLTERRDLDGE